MRSGVLPLALGAWSTARMADVMESPTAVPSASSKALMARSMAPRSVIGGAMIDGDPDIDTSATLYESGRSWTNLMAASLAAESRLGATSAADIDSDVSITITMVARSRGCLSTPSGLA